MKQVHLLITMILLLIASNNIWAQHKLVKDMDGDGIRDTVRIECVLQSDSTLDNYTYIACRLSSLQFEEMQSRKIFIPYWIFLEIRLGILSTKNGFEFFVNYTRDGKKAQFRYDKQAKRIQLIGMSRYETGNRKGKSSVNLLTGNYIGEWHAMDYSLDRQFRIPTIKTKMDFGTIYLEDFNEEIFSEYYKRCSSLF